MTVGGASEEDVLREVEVDAGEPGWEGDSVHRGCGAEDAVWD